SRLQGQSASRIAIRSATGRLSTAKQDGQVSSQKEGAGRRSLSNSFARRTSDDRRRPPAGGEGRGANADLGGSARAVSRRGNRVTAAYGQDRQPRQSGLGQFPRGCGGRTGTGCRVYPHE